MQLLGNLLKAVKPSPTLAITRKAAELRRNGGRYHQFVDR